MATLDIIFLFLDGANSMFGHISGLGVLIGKAFDYEIPVRHHCLAHKIQLILKKALGDFNVFSTLGNYVKQILSFFNMSAKRSNALKEFLEDLGSTSFFRFGSIIDVR